MAASVEPPVLFKVKLFKLVIDVGILIAEVPLKTKDEVEPPAKLVLVPVIEPLMVKVLSFIVKVPEDKAKSVTEILAEEATKFVCEFMSNS